MRRLAPPLALAMLLAASPQGHAQTPAPTPAPSAEPLPFGDTQQVEREAARKEAELRRLLESAEAVQISYARATHDEAEGVSLFEGNVRIAKKDFSLTAERVSYRSSTQELVATGEVEVKFGADELRADRLEYSLLLERGVLHDVVGRFQPDLFFTANKVEKIGNHPSTGLPLYAVTRGYFSACDPGGKTPAEGCVRDWSITSGRALVHQDHYIHLRGPAFWLRRVPVFFSPYLIVPIKPARSTGFLIPDVGLSVQHGFRLRNAFYWAIADNVDLTLAHEFRSRTGDGEDLELRWALGPASDGRLAASRRFQPAGPESSYQTIDQESYRGDLQARQDFGYDFRATLDARYATDVNFNRAYVDSFRQVSQDAFTSTAGLEKSLRGTHFLRLYGQDWRDLRENPNLDSLTILPRLWYRTSRLRLFGDSGLAVSGEFEADRLRRALGEAFPGQSEAADKELVVNLGRVRFDPTLSYRFQIPWLTLEPAFSLRTMWWSRRRFQDARGDSLATYGVTAPVIEEGRPLRRLRAVGEGAYRELLELGFGVEGPKVSRIFEVAAEPSPEAVPASPPPSSPPASGGGERGGRVAATPTPVPAAVAAWAQADGQAVPTRPFRLLRLKHVVFPSVRYSYVPAVPQGALIQLAPGDFLTDRSGFTYSLTNRLFGKVWRGAKSTEIVQMADLRLAQTYDLRLAEKLDDKRGADPTYAPRRYERPLSDLTADLDLRLGDYFRSQQRLAWDPYAGELSRVSTGFGVTHPRVDVSLYWGRSRTFDPTELRTESLDLRFGWRVSPRFRWDVSGNYNLIEEVIGWASLNTYVAFECWGFGIQSFYREFRPTPLEGLTEDYTIRFAISLKNLGSVADFSVQ